MASPVTCREAAEDIDAAARCLEKLGADQERVARLRAIVSWLRYYADTPLGLLHDWTVCAAEGDDE